MSDFKNLLELSGFSKFTNLSQDPEWVTVDNFINPATEIFFESFSMQLPEDEGRTIAEKLERVMGEMLKINRKLHKCVLSCFLSFKVLNFNG